MRNPLVSIIIPVYNGENYLREAIDSAISQTYSNIEVIVVNDGSTDNGATERIAFSYGEKIRYFAKENGGVATALNLAIKLMNGEYFSWLSHDDLYYPNKVEKQIEALRKNGTMTTIVQSDYDLFEVDTGTVTNINQSKMYSTEKITKSIFPVLQGIIHGCSLLIHKCHFERVGLFSEDLRTTQDYELWFRMFRHQTTIYIPEPLIMSRLHESQGSKTIDVHQAERENLYISFLDALTEGEMESLYGSSYNFYHRMACYFKGGNMTNSYIYANRKLQEAEIPDDLGEKLSNFHKYVNELTSGKAKKICIFGAGEYGNRLYQELKSKLVSIHFFSDNNAEKWGYLYENIECISPKELEEHKGETLVIVATRTPGMIVNQLLESKFPFIITKQEVDKVLMDVPPVKWITSLDNIENIDYSSKDVQYLMKKFNQTIYDICKYYENRQSR